MMKIQYEVGGRLMGCHDSALVLDDEDPLEALVQAVVQTISTNVEVTAGGVTLHLAAWMDPDHWEDDWSERGVDDPAEFIAELAEPSE